MRQAFVACVAFLILVVVVALRCGSRASPPELKRPAIVDAAITDAPIDATAVPVDAAPVAKKHATKPRPVPKPKPVIPIPTSGRPPPVIPPPQVGCTQPANPAGCPAKEPNINHPCDAEGVHCVYGASCCPPVYVCNDHVFEAWFTHCQ
ncbi:MAG: hypothetical protein ABJE66_08560 [Deltaproteobacteria bacterium]